MDRNFIARLETGRYQPSPIAFVLTEGLPCHFQAVAVYGSKGCRRIQEFIVDVRMISTSELIIQTPLCTFLPSSFTLVIGARQHGMGCTVYKRRSDRLHCQLIRRESRAMVAFLSTVTKPEKTLGELLHPLFPRPRLARKWR